MIFLKLYKWLVDYGATGHTGLAPFDTWMGAEPDRDDLTELPSGERGHRHVSAWSTSRASRLRSGPEALVFPERG